MSRARSDGAALLPTPHRNSPPLAARSISLRRRIASGSSPASVANFVQQNIGGNIG